MQKYCKKMDSGFPKPILVDLCDIDYFDPVVDYFLYILCVLRTVLISLPMCTRSGLMR